MKYVINDWVFAHTFFPLAPRHVLRQNVKAHEDGFEELQSSVGMLFSEGVQILYRMQFHTKLFVVRENEHTTNARLEWGFCFTSIGYPIDTVIELPEHRKSLRKSGIYNLGDLLPLTPHDLANRIHSPSGAEAITRQLARYGFGLALDQ